MIGWFSPRVFLGPSQRRLFATGLPVLVYHRIGPARPGALDPFLYVRPQRFEQQLAALRQAGIASVWPDCSRQAPGSWQRKVVITFDDGCCDVFEHAIEPLARYGFRAIQFLVAGFLGRTNEWDQAKGDVVEPLMEEAQVRDWLAAGHQIGSHTVSHADLTRVSLRAAREEILASKRSLEDRFGVAVEHFCYPFGKWNEAVSDLVAEAGYQTACTMEFGVNTPDVSAFELRRIPPLCGRELLAKARHRLARRYLQAGNPLRRF